MFDIKWIQDKVRKEAYYFSRHGDKERQNDNLTILEVEEAILNGMILEQYLDTGRGESCLVVGFTNFGKPIHVVCGKTNDEELTIITVYIPSPPKFKNLYERG
ncbi:hypothetical protein BIY37_00730 [Candidatus Brocadia sapporoensis]|uniref:DUF4258 domain-containing protein n=1 Tax=Candidatus Brocadia sapporoensis TaxID=392547 RepID=A0A1V6M3I6_9BACT|nr:DUF4258 domain-containing protein [Candidatus Brocadia sapporoensis]MBE7549417.1 DUF4258 domain-containing protein [Planctomycetia bacterium]MDG6004383.1 DUF4258 domain-containing protein [Candidatus Brocadia sp.]OQD46961.1 hypothetical protein BIY37_00730 [Candidatus Brocadia sapporoensis]GJQ24383.1 MAG: hypothetical protein HBSAPP01_21730 [Candidatus Brocadia sapporoensis]